MARRVDLGRRRTDGRVQRRPQVAAQHQADEGQPVGRHRRPAARPERTTRTAHPLAPGRTRTDRPTAPHTTHSSRYGWKPSAASSFRKKAGTSSGASWAARARNAAQQHLVQPGVGVALLRHLVARLQQRLRLGQPVEVLPHRPEDLDRLGLGDDVELAALVEQQRHVHHRLQPRPEPGLGLAHALGHRPHLAPALGQQGDDAVGLAQLDVRSTTPWSR